MIYPKVPKRVIIEHSSEQKCLSYIVSQAIDVRTIGQATHLELKTDNTLRLVICRLSHLMDYRCTAPDY